MSDMVTRMLKKLEKDLANKPDANLLNGYKKAMEDYEKTGNIHCKLAGDVIMKEMERRGIKLE